MSKDLFDALKSLVAPHVADEALRKIANEHEDEPVPEQLELPFYDEPLEDEPEMGDKEE